MKEFIKRITIGLLTKFKVIIKDKDFGSTNIGGFVMLDSCK